MPDDPQEGAGAANQGRPSKKPILIGALVGMVVGIGWGAAHFDGQGFAAGDHTSVHTLIAAVFLWGPLIGGIVGAMVRDWNKTR